MPLFRGPSDHVLLTTARGIAGEYAALGFLKETFDPNDKLFDSVKEDRAAQGLPNSKDEIAQMAADIISEYDLGWFKRNRFLGMVEGSLRAMGVSFYDAQHFKGLIEVYWHKKRYTKDKQIKKTEEPANPESNLFDFLKNETTGESGANAFLAATFSKDNPTIKEGRKLGDQCLENGLRKNEVVVLSTIRESIIAHFPTTANGVESGFLERMTEFVERGEIFVFSGPNKDLIWVHKDDKKNMP